MTSERYLVLILQGGEQNRGWIWRTGAHKAVAGASLAPSAALSTDWPMRLIQSGDYRVVISATDRNEHRVYTSPTLQFHVARKSVVESGRILPVAFGLSLLIGGVMAYRGWRQRRRV